ncbi:hypothetical protein CLU79DRAFT_729793 [Phycomyces nitens]|nr:hypothetical protein CLU79DRAFT_729793 [Phycomyces nitens]
MIHILFFFTFLLYTQMESLQRLPTDFMPSPAVHQGPDLKRTVVIAYDHTNQSDALLAKAIRLGVITPADDIRILHIICQDEFKKLFANTNMTEAYASHYISREDTGHDSAMMVAADMIMDDIIDVLDRHGFKNVKSEILRGDPKKSVIDYCMQCRPTYIITGTRGLGVLKRTFLGSVSDYIAKNCPNPVLVLKLTPEELASREKQDSQKQTRFSQLQGKIIKPRHMDLASH